MRLASISPGGERVRLSGLLLLADSGQHLGGMLHLFCWRRARDGGLWVELLFSQAALKGGVFVLFLVLTFHFFCIHGQANPTPQTGSTNIFCFIFVLFF